MKKQWASVLGIALWGVLSSLCPGASVEAQQGTRELAFLSRDLVDAGHLEAAARDGVEVVWLDPATGLLAQVTSVLEGRHGIRALHLVTHGRPGVLQLGANSIDRASLEDASDAIANWDRALTDDADILVYGCDVGSGNEGSAFVSRLSELSHADVAASDDSTGGASGADWMLETTAGHVSTELAFEPSALRAWDRMLITVSEGTDFSNSSPGSVYTLDVGTNTFSGVVTTPSDGQDNFQVAVPGGTQLTAVSLSLNTGGGFSGFVSFNLNESRTTSGSFTTGLPAGAGGGFGTSGAYTVQVVGNFAVGNSWSLTFTVASLGNTAPTNVALSSTNVNENAPANTAVGTLSTTDGDFGNTFTYSLVAGAGSADNASFNISGNTLRTSAVFDREAKSSYAVRIRTTDQGGLFFDRAFTITVNDLNDSAPVVTSPGTLSIAENSALNTNVGGALAATDADATTTLSNWSIVSGNTGGAFAINASTGQIRVANAGALNYEATTSYSLGVTVSDGTNTSASATIPISVTNVNESPTGVAITNASVVENSGPGTVIGTLSSLDPDAGGSFSYAIVAGLDGAYFAIGGDQLMVNLTNLDYEASTTRTVRIRTTDQGSLGFEQDIVITITNANEAPTAVSLGNASVMEYSADAIVGTVSSVDPDAGDTATYSLLGTDAAEFTLVGSTLAVGSSGLRRSAGTTRSVTIRATDAGGLTRDQSFVIQVDAFDTSLCGTLTVTPTTLPSGSIGVPLTSTTMMVSGGEGSVTWSPANAFPSGVSVTSGGTLGGTPDQAGIFSLMVQATDDRGCTGTGTVSLTVGCSTTASPAMAICGSVATMSLSASLPSSSVTGQWSDGGMGGSFSPSDTDPNATYTPSATFIGPVTLTWTLAGAGCDGTSTSVSVDVAEPGPGGCCNVVADCDDGDPCTVDGCDVDACTNVADPSCSVPDGGTMDDAGIPDAGVFDDAGLDDAGLDDAGAGGDGGDGGPTMGGSSDAGCSCSVPGGSSSRVDVFAWLLVAAGLRRRRRS